MWSVVGKEDSLPRGPWKAALVWTAEGVGLTDDRMNIIRMTEKFLVGLDGSLAKSAAAPAESCIPDQVARCCLKLRLQKVSCPLLASVDIGSLYTPTETCELQNKMNLL